MGILSSHCMPPYLLDCKSQAIIFHAAARRGLQRHCFFGHRPIVRSRLGPSSPQQQAGPAEGSLEITRNLETEPTSKLLGGFPNRLRDAEFSRSLSGGIEPLSYCYQRESPCKRYCQRHRRRQQHLQWR